MYCLICPFSKTFDEVWITYSVPDFLTNELKIWQIVEVTIREKIEFWVVLDITNIPIINFDESKIKSIISIKNDNIFLKKYRVDLIKWIANYYFTAIHNSLNLFFPKNLKEKIWKDKLKIDNNKNYSYTFNYNNSLSTEQIKAYNSIIETKTNKILFYWLTWSGKTEIYIKLINDYLNQGKQILFLIPEIILTNQLSDKIKKVFWEGIIILNSTITDANKTKYWIDINNWNAKIVIWTRSALFYPYNNLGLIIIDEEHDNSYISDSAPRYNTIKVAEKITELNWNKLVLWSWTPSINSMHKAIIKDYGLVNLLKVYNKKTM